MYISIRVCTTGKLNLAAFCIGALFIPPNSCLSREIARAIKVRFQYRSKVGTKVIIVWKEISPRTTMRSNLGPYLLLTSQITDQILHRVLKMDTYRCNEKLLFFTSDCMIITSKSRINVLIEEAISFNCFPQIELFSGF